MNRWGNGDTLTGTSWNDVFLSCFHRIYKASQRGDVKAYRRLQKTLMKSWAAKCLSVRRVTQDNQGKKTAGVDGLKSLSPEARLRLVIKLKLNSKVKPTRRVWIPKPGTEEKRPLGIPTMYDREKASAPQDGFRTGIALRDLNLTHMGSGLGARVMMRLRQYSTVSSGNQNSC